MAALARPPHQSKYGPVKFTDRGKLVLRGRSYLVPYKVDTHNLLSQLEPIERGLQNVQKLYQQVRTNVAYHTAKKILRDDKHLVSLLPPSFTEHLSYLVADAHLHRKNIRNFLDTLGERGEETASNVTQAGRDPRGLLDGAGELMRFAFGLATEKQVGQVTERVSSLEELVGALSERSLIHQDILNTSLIHIDLLERQQSRITECLTSIEGNLVRFANVSATRYSDIVHLLTLTNSLSYISAGLADLTATFSSFRQGMEVMKQGRMAVALLPEPTVLEIVQSITQKNLKLLFPGVKKFLGFYYQNVAVIRLLEPTEFVLSFPLLSEPDITFDLFEIQPLPHPLPSGRIVTYENLSPYLAISPDWSFQFELSTLTHCTQYRDLFLCDVDCPINKGVGGSCAAQLFHHDPVAPACKKHISSEAVTTSFTKAMHGWFYATTREVALSVSCPGKLSERITLPIGAGKLNYTNDCLISSTEFVLPAMADIFGPPFNHSNDVVSFVLSLSETEAAAVKMIDNEPLLADPVNAVGGSLPLKAMQTELGKLPDIRRLRQINTYASTGSLVVGGICLILTLIAIAFAYYVFKVCQGHVVRTQTITVNPVSDNRPGGPSAQHVRQ